MHRCIALLASTVLLAACSDDQSDQGHVWQEQTDAIQKAEDVNKLIIETDQQRRETIEQQSQ